MSDLLSRRILALQLDKDEIARIEPVTFSELQRLCALCESREQCEVDLADDFADVAWHAYCPNAAMVNVLGELPWFHCCCYRRWHQSSARRHRIPHGANVRSGSDPDVAACPH
jgi:hypothetical protein